MLRSLVLVLTFMLLLISSTLMADPPNTKMETGTEDAWKVLNVSQWSSADGGNDHWYGILTVRDGQAEAQRIAESLRMKGQSGYLATITTFEENEFIFRNTLVDLPVKRGGDLFFLGGTRNPDNSWSWLTGESFFFEHFAVTRPELRSDYSALTILGWRNQLNDLFRSGRWTNASPENNMEESYSYWAVIEWGELDPRTSPPVPDTLSELVQWRVEDGGNDHWYGLITLELFWDEAADLAASLTHNGMPGYLATPKTVEENDFIANQVVSPSNQPSVVDAHWLGAIHTDVWKWIDGTDLVYQGWAPNEPNNLVDETIVCMWGDNNFRYIRSLGMWNNSVPTESANPYAKWWSVVEFDPPASERETVDGDLSLPSEYLLGQNFPNPFNPSTTITFSLAQAGKVNITVYNVIGQEIANLTDREWDAGEHTLVWNSRNYRGESVASGVYLYQIQTDYFNQTRKMVLVR